MSETQLFKLLTPALVKLLVKKRQPTFIKPMLATLTNNYFSDKQWFYEHKFDGERCLVF